MSLARAMNSGMRSTVPISCSMLSAASLAPPCAGPQRQAMPAAMQANGLAPDEPASRTVEVEAFCSWSAWRMKMRSMARDEHRVDLVLLARHREAHAQEVRGVVERVQRINERLADVVLEGHRRDRRHLGDHAERRDHALVRVGDVGRVVIEGRQRADHAAHDRHRMRVAAEAGEEAAHLLVDHRVIGHAMVEVGLLRRRSAARRRGAGSRSRGSRRARRAARSGSRDRGGCPRRRR